MRTSPPPVEVNLSDGRRERVLVASLHALAALVLMAWLRQRMQWSPNVVLWAAAPLAAALCGWWMLRPLAGCLRWDGQAWSRLDATAEAAHACRVQLRWDLGNWILLRVRMHGPVCNHWSAVSRSQAGAAWHGFRLALYQQAGTDVVLGGDR